MVTCGGQAAIPMIAAVARVTPVHRGDLVARIAASTAGPSTLANLDAFVTTTAHAIERIGGARRGSAAIVLDATEPPTAMRDRIVCLCQEADPAAIRGSIAHMLAAVQSYVPGYRLDGEISIEPAGRGTAPGETGPHLGGLAVTIQLEVGGAGHHLPAHAGNLDIMTSAALHTAETLVARTAPVCA
jgi:acetaldehyde dehydrogenase